MNDAPNLRLEAQRLEIGLPALPEGKPGKVEVGVWGGLLAKPELLLLSFLDCMPVFPPTLPFQ